jgi:hypothetical protein
LWQDFCFKVFRKKEEKGVYILGATARVATDVQSGRKMWGRHMKEQLMDDLRGASLEDSLCLGYYRLAPSGCFCQPLRVSWWAQQDLNL